MSGNTQRILAYAVRSNAILKYHGALCISLVGIAGVPAIFALLAGDLGFAGRAAAGLAVLGGAGFFLSRVHGPRQLQSNEALVVIALGYVFTAILMAWPLAADGIEPLDALFHAASAVTTTGLSTIGSVEARSTSFLFAQAWMQWYGGLVIVVLAVFLVGPGSAAKELSATDLRSSEILSGTRSRAYHALLIYGGLTAIGILILLLLGADWFDAVLYALAAVSTGGFSTHDDSLQGLGSWPLQVGVMVVAVTGAISFTRYQRLIHRSGGQRQGVGRIMGLEVFTLFILFVAIAGLTGISMSFFGGMAWADALRTAPLLAVSAQTTTGFSPVAVEWLHDSSKLILIVSMLIGGDLGSTAGGIKLFRFLLIIRLVQLALLRPALPTHAVTPDELGGKPLDQRDLHNAVGIVALFGGVVLASWLVFVMYGHPPIDSLFEVVSATATVGLSTGLTGPDLEPILKVILCLNMWMGRLEILAVVILFYPHTWFGRRAHVQ